MENYRGGHPALAWLVKSDPDGALAVLATIRDAGQHHTPESPHHATDGEDAQTHEIPDTALTLEDLAEATQDGPDDLAPERLHEEHPSERELLSALGWIEWPSVGRRGNGNADPIGWAERAPARNAGAAYSCQLADGATLRPTLEPYHTSRLRGLRYYTRAGARRGRDGGMLLDYAVGSGKPMRPRFVAEKPRGGKRLHRTTSGVESYLALHGAVASPMAAIGWQRPFSGRPALQPMYAPQTGVAEARALLVELGVDGSVPCADLARVTRHPVAVIAKGARFISGIVGASETASSPAPTWQEPAGTLGDVLDEVAARGTLQSIGVRLGYRGGYADRAGKRALLAEASRLLAANDNRRAAADAA